MPFQINLANKNSIPEKSEERGRVRLAVEEMPGGRQFQISRSMGEKALCVVSRH